MSWNSYHCKNVLLLVVYNLQGRIGVLTVQLYRLGCSLLTSLNENCFLHPLYC